MLVEFTCERNSQYPFIGILGGMGPEATAELYLRVIRLFQEKGAYKDSDFPRMLILNLPLPDVVEEVDEDAVRKALLEGVRGLASKGVDFITIPCNTVTAYLKELQEAVPCKILSIIEETAKEIGRDEQIGILGTTTTIESNLYGEELGREVIYPNEKEKKETTNTILNILKGKKEKKESKILQNIIEKMKEQGAERIILGCTELPLLIQREDCIDTIDVLARAIYNYANR